MSLYKTNLTVSASILVFGICVTAPPIFASFIGIGYGFVPLIACYGSAFAGLVAGLVWQGRAWQKFNDQQNRSNLIQRELNAEHEANNFFELEGGCKTFSGPATSSDDEISGSIFERLQRAITSFPTRYPEYSTKPPKLDDDVRRWLEESGIVENQAERRVFGAIIREHFKLASDALKV